MVALNRRPSISLRAVLKHYGLAGTPVRLSCVSTGDAARSFLINLSHYLRAITTQTMSHRQQRRQQQVILIAAIKIREKNNFQS